MVRRAGCRDSQDVQAAGQKAIMAQVFSNAVCGTKGGLPREMPETWQGLHIQARVVLKSLWIQSRNLGLTLEVSDVMICSQDEPTSCPFPVDDP